VCAKWFVPSFVVTSFFFAAMLEFAIEMPSTSAAATGSLPVFALSERAVLACSPKALFYAAVAKEHFNPNDPSYTKLGQRPTAYDSICDGGWAFALISRPNVGTSDGFTVFKLVTAGKWIEVGETGPNNDACSISGLGVPAKIALVLARGVSSGEFCNLPHAYSIAQSMWVAGRCSAPSQLIAGMNGWWSIAQTLQRSAPAYGGNPKAYRQAIFDLNSIATIVKAGNYLIGPGSDGIWLTSRNPAFRSDIAQLNIFFHTSNFFNEPTLPACYTS